VKSAIKVGVRHFDTAAIYDTEKPLGKALNDEINAGHVTREDLFVTTKIWSTNHRRELVVPAMKKCLEALGLDYVDLALVHWPCAIVPSETEIFPRDEHGEVMFEDDRTSLSETWQGMEECKRLGLARSIGVSNYNIEQLKETIKGATTPPAVNQVETHPYFTNKTLVDFCKKNSIVVTAFSPLGKPQRTWAKPGESIVFTDPVLNEIATKYNKKAAQVALRFQYQRGVVVVPKSNSAERQRENLNIFDFALTEEEMAEIFTKCDRDLRVLYLDVQVQAVSISAAKLDVRT